MQFTCPFCGGLFEVDASYAGMQVACPRCGGVVLVPGAVQPPIAPPPPVTPTGQFGSIPQPPAVPPAPPLPTFGTMSGSIVPPPPPVVETKPATEWSMPPVSIAPVPTAPQVVSVEAPPHSRAAAKRDAPAEQEKRPVASVNEMMQPTAPRPKRVETSPPPAPEVYSPPRPSGGVSPGTILVPMIVAAQAPTPVSTQPTKPVVTDPTQIDTHRAKQIGYGDEQRELRQLSPEEKSRRRLMRNFIMLTLGTLILIGLMAILLRVKP